MNKTETLKTWCSIDLDAIAHNYNYIKQNVSSRIICVVKAGAYGHGAVQVARRLADEGCDFFAVSSIEEALELREGGIDTSILILGYVLPSRLDEAIENDISFACASYDFAKILCEKKSKKRAKIHIKLNTGMNRTGFCVCHDEGKEELKKALSLIKQSDNVCTEGVFSHFAKAEDDIEFSEKQCAVFEETLSDIKKSGIVPSIVHICNSAGTHNFKDKHFDAVRVGIHLYGCEAPDENYIRAMDFCTRIVDVHTLEKGDGVSYGLDFVAEKKMKIAVIGVGYADGFFRALSDGKGKVSVNGKICPTVGRVCMDMAMIDVSEVENVAVGDVVTVWGKALATEEQAKNASTISYELMCSVSPRVPRIY